MDTTSRRRTGGMSVMNMGNIVGDPFALATVSIAMVRFILCAWHIFEYGSGLIWSHLVGMVDRIYFLNRCSNPVAIPELLMVDRCIHAFLYNWRVRGYRIKHNRDLSRSDCWIPCSWPRPDYILR
jgi:hypothetical protein